MKAAQESTWQVKAQVEAVVLVRERRLQRLRARRQQVRPRPRSAACCPSTCRESLKPATCLNKMHTLATTQLQGMGCSQCTDGKTKNPGMVGKSAPARPAEGVRLACGRKGVNGHGAVCADNHHTPTTDASRPAPARSAERLACGREGKSAARAAASASRLCCSAAADTAAAVTCHRPACLQHATKRVLDISVCHAV